MIQLNKINFLSNKNENLLIKKKKRNVLKKEEKIMKGKTNTKEQYPYMLNKFKIIL
jgi:hypothetical protein